MRRHGVRCSPEEFHAAVNITFHQYESEVYDELHQDMWAALPHEFALLAQDCLDAAPALPDRIRMLDIGCGTGLASDSLLRSPLGPRISEIHLLDTSPAMLLRCAQRASGWGVPFTRFEGLADTLAGRGCYDLIVVCSVLHHIPDLEGFLGVIRRLQAPGGVFLHIQDPNGDHLNDPELRQRMAAVSTQRPEWRLSPRRILGRIYRELAGKQRQDYLSKVNQELVQKGIVATPLTVSEIFAITDIHVQDGEGISIAKMAPWLPDYKLLSARSYGYFGVLESTLPVQFKQVEEELSAQRSMNGFHLGAAWQLTTS